MQHGTWWFTEGFARECGLWGQSSLEAPQASQKCWYSHPSTLSVTSVESHRSAADVKTERDRSLVHAFNKARIPWFTVPLTGCSVVTAKNCATERAMRIWKRKFYGVHWRHKTLNDGKYGCETPLLSSDTFQVFLCQTKFVYIFLNWQHQNLDFAVGCGWLIMPSQLELYIQYFKKFSLPSLNSF